MPRSRGGRWSWSATFAPLASTSSPKSTDASPASIRSSVVLPEPLRPDSVIRSRRSSLNEIPRSSGSPAMSLPRSDAITTAMAMMVGPGSTGPAAGVSDSSRCACAPRLASRPAVRDAARAHRAGRRPRRVLPARHGRRRAGGDAAARLDGQRRPQLVRPRTATSQEAGYRVLAIDHRGHGRGLRPIEPFRLERLRGRRRRRPAGHSASRRRPSSVTRWAARSPSSSPTSSPTSSAASS